MAAPVRSVDPRTGIPVEDVAPEGSPADVDAAVRGALPAVPALAALGIEGRAPLGLPRRLDGRLELPPR